MEVSPFPYSDVGGPGHGGVRGPVDPLGADVAHSPTGSDGAASEEGDHAAQLRLAYDKGVREGEARARAGFEGQVAKERSAIAAAIENFGAQNQTYYQKVEVEIVQLALSIAGKVLHREAQMDPLLLAGIVRVVLTKMQAGTKVTLRVHPSRVASWREFFIHHMEGRDLPDVVEDPSLACDRCTVETTLGVTELGLEVQLKEIEHGLMDLLAQRPQTELAAGNGS